MKFQIRVFYLFVCRLMSHACPCPPALLSNSPSPLGLCLSLCPLLSLFNINSPVRLSLSNLLSIFDSPSPLGLRPMPLLLSLFDSPNLPL